jgi:hypothetical protein
MDRYFKGAMAAAAQRRTPSILTARGPPMRTNAVASSSEKGHANQIGFAATSEQYGGGFIVEADRLRGKTTSCKIKTRKEEGELINIVAGRASDIMLSNVQFSLKSIEPNKIARVFPGIMDMEIN